LRKLSGHSYNCEKPLLGRIVKDDTESKHKKHSVFVTNSPNKNGVKYLAVITDAKEVDSRLLSSGGPIALGVSRIDELNTGDVVRLNPDGNIEVLYERESPHNCLFVTEQCNCSCIICPQYTTKTKSDFTDSVLELIKLIDPQAQTLGITGGEPTLLGDNFFRIIQACKKHLPNTAIQILSNGIKFSDFDFTKNFALIAHPNIQIGIPLYADTDTDHNHIVQVNGFFKTIKGIQNLALFKQKIEIRTVINALNYKRLPQMAEFIYRNFPFVIHVAFMGMETRELAKKNLDQVWIDPYEYQSYLNEAVEILSLRQMNVSIYNHQLCVLPKTLWRFAKKSISGWKNIYLNECKTCDYNGSCGGFFASSKNIHSIHIKAIKRKQHKPNYAKGCVGIDSDLKSNVSPTFLKFAERIASIKNYPILDVPCGYGRHSVLLAKLGCKIICVDINSNALNFVLACGEKYGFKEDQLTTFETDLINDPWAFCQNSVGAIVNVHYYQYVLLDNFINSIISGGYLYLETPGNYRGNFADLPTKGLISAKLSKFFEILYYKEQFAGPSNSNLVTVKLFAQKKQKNIMSGCKKST